MGETHRHPREVKVLPAGAENTSRGQDPLKAKEGTRDWRPEQPTAKEPASQPKSASEWPVLTQGSLVGGKSIFLGIEELSLLSDASGGLRLGRAAARCEPSWSCASHTHGRTRRFEELQTAAFYSFQKLPPRLHSTAD